MSDKDIAEKEVLHCLLWLTGNEEGLLFYNKLKNYKLSCSNLAQIYAEKYRRVT